jgi:hypothetical protein
MVGGREESRTRERERVRGRGFGLFFSRGRARPVDVVGDVKGEEEGGIGERL